MQRLRSLKTGPAKNSFYLNTLVIIQYVFLKMKVHFFNIFLLRKVLFFLGYYFTDFIFQIKGSMAIPQGFSARIFGSDEGRNLL